MRFLNMFEIYALKEIIACIYERKFYEFSLDFNVFFMLNGLNISDKNSVKLIVKCFINQRFKIKRNKSDMSGTKEIFQNTFSIP